MRQIIFLLLMFFCVRLAQAQEIALSITDGATKEPVIAARIELLDGRKFVANTNGISKISCSERNFPLRGKVSAVGYENNDFSFEFKGFEFEYVVVMTPKEKTTQTVVVSASRREQDVAEVPVSMEILTTAQITNKGYTGLDQIVDQSPGVYAMDGQVSIRGGGGYAYGAGSRVLLVWNGIPMMSPDIGDAKWNSIPVEQTDQIEILKGASSVLYGSGALNGTISLTEREPSKIGDLRVRIQSGFFDQPRRQELTWWSRAPLQQMADVYYGRTFKRFGFSAGINGLFNEGYKQGEKENRVRLNGSIFYRIGQKQRARLGISYNAQYEDIGIFVLWRGANEALLPLDNTLTNQRSIRLNLDPYLLVFDKKNNKHYLRTRYYLVSTGSIGNLYATSKAEMYYADYQFSRKQTNLGNFTSGLTSIYNLVSSYVFGNHFSQNLAAYAKWDKKIRKFDFTAGTRIEYMKQDQMAADSRFEIGSLSVPVSPIFRGAVHYKAGKLSHLRASVGQGIRFPSVAERFVSTSVGSLIIFKNPNLKPETGWTGELGWKQLIPLNKEVDLWTLYADASVFINQYSNMTEFTFGVYNPDTIALSIDPNDIGYFGNWIGFQAQNAEKARITGIELSLNSKGELAPGLELISLIGYTYMNPVSLNRDSLYRATFSNPNTDMLKYRFKHLFKADVQLTYKKFGFGISGRYNSFMTNIDLVFESVIFGQELLPGLKDYREIYNKGVFVFDTRFLYAVNRRISFNFIVNNLFNAEYVSRPGDIQPPRTFLFQLRYGIE